jgi:hypothetical protein
LPSLEHAGLRITDADRSDQCIQVRQAGGEHAGFGCIQLAVDGFAVHREILETLVEIGPIKLYAIWGRDGSGLIVGDQEGCVDGQEGLNVK